MAQINSKIRMNPAYTKFRKTHAKYITQGVKTSFYIKMKLKV